MIKQILMLITLIFHVLTVHADILSGQVTEVIDGDTFVLMDDRFQSHTVRIMGIDAPEYHQRYGKEAKYALDALIGMQQVSVKTSQQDQYERTLGKVLLSGEDIGLTQIKRGFAWHYKGPKKGRKNEDFALYAQAHKQAKAEKIGLWQDEKPVSPARWRHRAKRPKNN